ncbi:hypothetical protein [Magnetofaba australis]|uniref:Putative transmembrane protein n=1 Tax=Magnetofaba australis IT-1 TaxID=1434232 RepID=A0A1Y2JZJ7_9PROT|nr:hypothetical protein [Magnetofaba australis]OSM00299.1 putative transmembrane protein [Magnetofaba australis IT-1]
MAVFPRKTRYWLDGLMVIALIAVGYAVGLRHLNQVAPDHNVFSDSHRQFAPAVMLACGRGFVDVASVRPPALTRFLAESQAQRAQRFDCAELPPDLRTRPISQWQGANPYLPYVTGWMWRWRGIDWDVMLPLLALLHGVVGGLAYLLFRYGMGRPPALLMAAYVLASDHFLAALESFPHYVKTPFVMAVFVLLLMLALRRRPWWLLLLLATVLGLVVGVGDGFSLDLDLAIPPAVVTLLAFARTRIGDATLWGARVVAVMLFFVGVLSGTWPMAQWANPSSNPAPMLISGADNAFIQQLRLKNSLYEVSYMQGDAARNVRIRDYAARVMGLPLDAPSAAPDDHPQPAEIHASDALFLEMLNRTPADFIARGLASAQRIADEGAIKRNGWLAITLAWLLLALYSSRLALFAGLFYLYFAAVPGLLFRSDHSFHLKVLPLFALGFLLWLAVRPLAAGLLRTGWFDWRARQRRFLVAVSNNFFDVLERLSWRPLAVAGLTLTLLVSAPLWLARGVQDARMRAYIEEIVALPVQTLSMRVKQQNDVSVLLELKNFPPRARADTPQVGYLTLTFSRARCGLDRTPIGLRYEGLDEPLATPSRRMRVMLPESGNLTLYLPVYAQEQLPRFQGLEIDRGGHACLIYVGQTAPQALREQAPLLLSLALPWNWRETPLYLTFPKWGERYRLSDWFTHQQTHVDAGLGAAGL